VRRLVENRIAAKDRRRTKFRLPAAAAMPRAGTAPATARAGLRGSGPALLREEGGIWAKFINLPVVA